MDITKDNDISINSISDSSQQVINEHVEDLHTSKKNYFVLDSFALNEQIQLNKKQEELFESRGEYTSKEIAGLYFQGTQYFDLKDVHFINNTGIANLLDILRSQLEEGIEVKFVNVNTTVKNKFKSLGLECIFNCL